MKGIRRARQDQELRIASRIPREVAYIMGHMAHASLTRVTDTGH
jgi:hypothetical protein